jgi:hypothetical protein
MKTKEGLQEKWNNWTKINSEDDYSKACVHAADAVALKLDEGATPEDALEALKGRELTGFMASEATKAVAHFHPRGEEIRVAWNEMNGVKSEKRIVNTAILNVDDDGTMSPEFQSV